MLARLNRRRVYERTDPQPCLQEDQIKEHLRTYLERQGWQTEVVLGKSEASTSMRAEDRSAGY